MSSLQELLRHLQKATFSEKWSDQGDSTLLLYVHCMMCRLNDCLMCGSSEKRISIFLYLCYCTVHDQIIGISYTVVNVSVERKKGDSAV